jgi:hypothetical protein
VCQTTAIFLIKEAAIFTVNRKPCRLQFHKQNKFLSSLIPLSWGFQAIGWFPWHTYAVRTELEEEKGRESSTHMSLTWLVFMHARPQVGVKKLDTK